MRGTRADTRLQNIVLEAELAAMPPDADDDRLRIHHALAANHDALGEYRQALTHGQHELALRTAIQSPDHPETLTTRHDIAAWTGQCGDARAALRLFRELLPDQERVLGPDHPDTLDDPQQHRVLDRRVRGRAEALRLFRELLPDQERVLGADHPDTLTTRHNIADWTGESGDAARGAAAVPGAAARPGAGARPGPPRHAHDPRATSPPGPASAGTRGRRCACSGSCCPTRSGCSARTTPTPSRPAATSPSGPGERGDAAEALRLFQELLPDQERVLGPDHPDTLSTRSNIAYGARILGEGSGQ